MITEVQLSDVASELAKNLSGGQKRKLQLGIALLGGSEVLVLDEPTSGMDSTMRRKFWEIVKKYKADRYTILTTHYMDEAEELGDKICVLNAGRVYCEGTPLSLKAKFATGVNLTLQINQETQVKAVQDFISSKMSTAKIKLCLSNQVVWIIPESTGKDLSIFFSGLDSFLNLQQIGNYTVTTPSLAELLLITTTEYKPEENQKSNSSCQTSSNTVSGQDQARSFNLTGFRTLVHMKLLLQAREPKGLIFDILMPCLMIIGGFYVQSLEAFSRSEEVQSLSVYDFPKGSTLIHNSNSVYNEVTEIEEFIENAFGVDIGPQQLWSEVQQVQIDTTNDFFDQIKSLDQSIFEAKNEHIPSFGQFFFQRVDPEERFYSIGVLANATHPSAALSYATYALQGIIRAETKNKNFRLNFFQGELPFSLRWQSYMSSGIGVLLSLSVTFAYTMISDSQVQIMVRERASGIKLQVLQGVCSKFTYLLSHFIVHLVIQTIPAVTVLACTKYFEKDVPDIDLILLHFVIVNTMFVHALAYLFNCDSKASIVTRLLYFAAGAVAPLAIQVLQVINKDTVAVAALLKPYFLPFPIYNVNIAYISISNRQISELLLRLEPDSISPLDWGCAGENLFMIKKMGCCCLFFLVITECNRYLSIERFLQKLLYFNLQRIHNYLTHQIQRRKLYPLQNIDENKLMASPNLSLFGVISTTIKADRSQHFNDEDPFIESQRVKQIKTSLLKVEGLCKSYSPFRKSVDGLSFALEAGECFALLGTTGSGKTTTFKCLTGQIDCDSGCLQIDGREVSDSRTVIGYCPQFDTLILNFTVREHFQFFSSLKGKQLNQDELIRLLNRSELFEYRDMRVHMLSGGNKRKLQFSLALINNPRLIFLDEPTSGVDLCAKRSMWAQIQDIVNGESNSAVVLTTHSMEEADALSSKLGIMVDGRFRCFGSPQYIRQKYSEGIRIKLQDKINSFKSLGNDDNSVVQNHSKSREQPCQKHFQQSLVNALPQTKVLPEIETPEHLKTQNREIYIKNRLAILQTKFGDCRLTRQDKDILEYRLDSKNLSMGFVFAEMSLLKERGDVGHFEISLMSLEEVFNKIASQGTENEQILMKTDKVKFD